jgi:hypothetical protein
MRPYGTFGEISQALLEAALTPGRVSDLAARAQVSYASARYTASRLVERGALRVHQPGRPAKLVAAPLAAPPFGATPGAAGPQLQDVWATFV